VSGQKGLAVFSHPEPLQQLMEELDHGEKILDTLHAKLTTQKGLNRGKHKQNWKRSLQVTDPVLGLCLGIA